MKKCFFIVFVASVMLLMYINCSDISTNYGDAFDLPRYPLHVRNTSTTSGVYFWYERWIVLGYLVQGPEWTSKYLPKSPEPGVPVDTTINMLGGTSGWYVQREKVRMAIASGAVYFDCEKWLLIEETDGVWTCTWSDAGWE